MKILLDMNLSPAWAPILNRAGFQCKHWRDIGKAGAPDTVVMSWAREHGYVVFTHDMDFGTLLAVTGANGPSVLQVRVANPSPEAIAHDVIRLSSLRRDLFDRGVLVTLDKARARIRVLPLGATSNTTEEPEWSRGADIISPSAEWFRSPTLEMWNRVSDGNVIAAGEVTGVWMTSARRRGSIRC